MDITKKIFKNAGILICGEIIVKLLSIILTVYLIRFLGAGQFGIYSFALVFTEMFVVFSEMGLNPLIVREVARNRNLAGKYLGNAISLKAILSIIAFGLMLITLKLMRYSSFTIYITSIFGLSVLIGSLSEMIGSIYQAFESMKYNVFVNIINKLMLLLSIILILFLGYNLVRVGYIFVLVSILIFILTLSICRNKFTRVKLDFDLAFWRNIFKSAFPMGLTYMLTFMFFRIDVIMLSKMASDKIVGLYSAAYNLFNFWSFLPLLFLTAAFPAFSRLHTTSKHDLIGLYEKSFHYLFIVGLPIVLGTVVLADRIVPFLYGKEFVPSIIALKILIWAVPIVFANYIFGVILNSIDKPEKRTIACFLSLILNLGLNFILIPLFSYLGSAIATIITQTFYFIISFIFVSKYLYPLPLHRIILKPAVAGMLTGFMVYLLGVTNLFYLVILAMFGYLILLYVLKAIPEEAINLIKKFA